MKMVKFYCCTLSAFFLALMLFSCEKDDAEPSPYLSFSIDESFVKEGISFDYKGGSMDIVSLWKVRFQILLWLHYLLILMTGGAV